MTSSSLPKVLVLGKPRSASVEDVDVLKEFADLVTIPQMDTRAEYQAAIKSAIAEHGGFIAVLLFIVGANAIYPLDEEFFAPLVATGLKMITAGGAGYDRTDVEYLSVHGCYYANNPVSVSQRTADGTSILILNALRGLPQQAANLRAGRWVDRTLVARDSRTTTLGIIGMGAIGSKVALNMQFFGMKIIYSKRTQAPDDDKTGFTYVSQEELIKTADVICLLCPLTKDTRHLLSAKEFDMMKPNVIIVNTSRGPVIDEAALVEALESGKVLRAALDVYEQEPIVHPGLLKSEKTFLTPHCTAHTETLALDIELERIANVVSFFKTGTPNTPVNSF